MAYAIEEWQMFAKAGDGVDDLRMQTLLEANKRMLTEERDEEETLLDQYQMLIVTRSTVS